MQLSALPILPYIAEKINNEISTFRHARSALGLGAGLHDLIPDILGNLHVVTGLHRILAAALRTGAEVGSIAKHLGQRHIGVDLLGATAGLQLHDLSAAGIQIAITSPIYSSGTMTLTFMIGSCSVGSAFRQASLKAMEPAILKAISEESTS